MPGSLISAVRGTTRTGASWAETADLVSDVLWLHMPTPEILTAEQRYGDPAGYRCHLLHAEPDGTFSVVALVWRPGQATPIHDHVTWCVFGVIQGAEHEERYTLRGDGWLEQAGTAVNVTGDVAGRRPPATFTACATPGRRPLSRYTSTAPTSAGWIAASAGSTTCLSSPGCPADNKRREHSVAYPCIWSRSKRPGQSPSAIGALMGAFFKCISELNGGTL